jgi:hypothetical protein
MKLIFILAALTGGSLSVGVRMATTFLFAAKEPLEEVTDATLFLMGADGDDFDLDPVLRMNQL